MSNNSPETHNKSEAWGKGLAICIGLGMALGVARGDIVAGIALGFGIAGAFTLVYLQPAKK